MTYSSNFGGFGQEHARILALNALHCDFCTDRDSDEQCCRSVLSDPDRSKILTQS